MKTYFNYQIAALLLAASFPGVARAQTAPQVAPNAGTLQQFLSGDLVPLDLKFSQMQKGWSRVQIERKGAASDKSPRNLSRSPDSIENGIRQYFGKDSEFVFTQGGTVNLNGEDQLVIYRAQFPSFNETDAWFEARTPDEMKGSQQLEPERLFKLMFPVVRQFLDTVPIRASLISTSEIASLRDIEPFSFERAFTALQNDVRQKEMARISQTQIVQSVEPEPRLSLQMLAQGFEQYIRDYDGVLPPLDNWAVANQALQPYIKSEIKMEQPQRKIHPNSLLSRKKMVHLASYARSLVAFYSDADENGQRWIVFLDGNIEETSATEWARIKKASRVP